MESGPLSKPVQPCGQVLSIDPESKALIAEALDGAGYPKQPTPWGFDLWEHIYQEHGVILMESELQEIVRLARAIP